MRECAKGCLKGRNACEEEKCRMWIDYKEDLNCTLICVAKHGRLTLNEVAKRMSLSIVRIKQIQDKALQKLQKNRRLKSL